MRPVLSDVSHPWAGAGGQQRVGARASSAQFVLVLLCIRIDRTCQVVHSTGAFLLENHSNHLDRAVNYGGLLWMKLDFSLYHLFDCCRLTSVMVPEDVGFYFTLTYCSHSGRTGASGM